jgi:hypothetical protein
VSSLRKTDIRSKIMKKWSWVVIIAALIWVILLACSPYAGLDIGVPFKVGPVYVSPSIGVGGFL